MTTRVAADPFDFVLTDRRVQRLFERAPRVTFFHIRDAMGRIFGSHRREWLQRKDVNFRRGGMRADRLRQGAGVGASQSSATFFYRVMPQQKTVPEGQRVDLSDITGESFSESDVALGLETGGTFTAQRSRMIAIPIGVTLDRLGRPKSKWVTPTRFRRSSARNKLVLIQQRGKAPILFQVKGGGTRSGKRRGGTKSKSKRVLLPAYMLVPRIQRRPRLKYLHTWDTMGSGRGRRLREALDRIVRDIERGRQ